MSMNQYKGKMKIINQCIENGDYKKAIQALVIVIERINIDTIYQKYHPKEKKLHFYDIMEIYRLSDEARYEIMIDVNDVYEQMTNKEIEARDCAQILKQNCEKLIELSNEK